MRIIRCKDHYGKWHEIEREKFIFRVSAYGILHEKEKLLMVKDRWSKKWELPGGGVKPYESIQDALIREFAEETGLRVDSKTFITLVEDFFYAEDRDEAWHTLRLIYTVNFQSGQVQAGGNGDDVIEAKFLNPAEISNDAMKEEVRALLYQVVL